MFKSEDRQNRYPTPSEFVTEWDQKNSRQRLASAERIINNAQMASECFVKDHHAHIAMLERVLEFERAKVARVEAEITWLYSNHDGMENTDDYPFIARRLRAALAGPVTEEAQ